MSAARVVPMDEWMARLERARNAGLLELVGRLAGKLNVSLEEAWCISSGYARSHGLSVRSAVVNFLLQ